MPVNFPAWNISDSAKYSYGVAIVAGVTTAFVHPQYPSRQTAGAQRIRTRVGVPPGDDYSIIIERITFLSLNATLVGIGFPPG